MKTTFGLHVPDRPCECGHGRGWTLHEVKVACDELGVMIATRCVWKCEHCGHGYAASSMHRDNIEEKITNARAPESEET